MRDDVRDAARYRWLRAGAGQWKIQVQVYDDGDWRRETQKRLDDAIDAAMDESEQMGP